MAPPTSDLLNWPKILYQYGPFALSVFLLFYAERVARANKEKAIASKDQLEIRHSRQIYGFVWAFFIACSCLSLYAWMTINLPPTHLVQGAILQVPADDKVVIGTNFQPQEAYLAMHEHLSKLDWLFISPTPLPDTMTLYISVTRTLRDSGTVQASFFMIPLDRDLYSKPLTMLFDPDKLTIDAHGNVFLSTTTKARASPPEHRDPSASAAVDEAHRAAAPNRT